MQRAVIRGAGLPLEIVPVTAASLPVPRLGAVIEIHCAGVCHSDIHFIDDETDMGGGTVSRIRDDIGSDFLTFTPGHEISGRVLSLGNHVDARSCNISLGDRVVVYPWIGCRQCGVCKEGYNCMCSFNPNGVKDIGQSAQGGFATHCSVPEVQYLIKLHDSIPFDVGCMFACSGLTSYWSLERARPAVELASKCGRTPRLLIIGAGGLGTWCAQIARQLYGTHGINISVADIWQSKLDGLPAGATDQNILLSEDTKAVQDNAESIVFGAGKMDVIINFVGNPATTQTSLLCAARGAYIINVGLWGGAADISMVNLIGNSLTLAGVRTGPVHCLQELVDLYSKSPITPPNIVPYKLCEVNKALDDLRRGDIHGRGIIYMDMHSI